MLNNSDSNIKIKNIMNSANYGSSLKFTYKKLLEVLFSAEPLKGTGESSSFNIVKVVAIYRYISLLVTSALFLFMNIGFDIREKLTIILFLAVEAQLVIFLFARCVTKLKKIKGIIVFESIASVILLYISGDLSSPFLWYSMNPIFAAAVFYKNNFCWKNLIVYFVGILVASRIYYKNIFDNSFILYYLTTVGIFFLIVFGLRQLMKYTGELNKQAQLLRAQNRELCSKLDESNKAMTESEKQVRTLYKSVEAFTTQENIVDLIKNIAEYATIFTKNDRTFFWYIDENKKHHIEFNSEEATKNRRDLIAARLYEEVQNLEGFQDKVFLKVLNEDYLIYKIKSTSRLYGVLGIKISDGTDKYSLYENQLSYVMNLSVTAIQSLEFKRLHIDLTDRA